MSATLATSVACNSGNDDATATAADARPATSTGDVADQAATSVRDLADRMDCEVDEAGSADLGGITYMAPVRSGIMTDAAVCRLHGSEDVHVFFRPSDRGPLTDDELSHAFTHSPPPSEPGSGGPSPACSPWLVIGQNYVVQVGSDSAAEDVRDALGSDAVRAESTTRTPISLLVPAPC